MSCQDTQNLLHGYVDGELDLLNNLRIERHLQDCPACARAYQNQKSLRSALGDGSLYFNAPAKLRERVRRDVRAGREEPRPTVLSLRWLAAGLSFALVASIGIGEERQVWRLLPSAPLTDLLSAVLAGGQVTACTQCAARRGIGEGDVIAGVRIAGAAVFVEESLAEGAQALVY